MHICMVAIMSANGVCRSLQSSVLVTIQRVTESHPDKKQYMVMTRSCKIAMAENTWHQFNEGHEVLAAAVEYHEEVL
jgi:hypothetical protein